MVVVASYFGRIVRKSGYPFSGAFFMVFMLEVVLWSVPDICGDQYPHLDQFLLKHNALYQQVQPAGNTSAADGASSSCGCGEGGSHPPHVDAVAPPSGTATDSGQKPGSWVLPPSLLRLKECPLFDLRCTGFQHKSQIIAGRNGGKSSSSRAKPKRGKGEEAALAEDTCEAFEDEDVAANSAVISGTPLPPAMMSMVLCLVVYIVSSTFPYFNKNETTSTSSNAATTIQQLQPTSSPVTTSPLPTPLPTPMTAQAELAASALAYPYSRSVSPYTPFSPASCSSTSSSASTSPSMSPLSVENFMQEASALPALPSFAITEPYGGFYNFHSDSSSCSTTPGLFPTPVSSPEATPATLVQNSPSPSASLYEPLMSWDQQTCVPCADSHSKTTRKSRRRAARLSASPFAGASDRKRHAGRNLLCSLPSELVPAFSSERETYHVHDHSAAAAVLPSQLRQPVGLVQTPQQWLLLAQQQCGMAASYY
eukprot:TRINITY_DN16969_c0_g1_i1.p1 TRINITY_DN16969_c0_g1~~TRINITY_DN16969_c0_g1_i1.p1  ORF type:complete len:508 (+),score=68.23 TRINITY_DN16969_c0_g1_i1:84-1526(+)